MTVRQRKWKKKFQKKKKKKKRKEKKWENGGRKHVFSSTSDDVVNVLQYDYIFSVAWKHGITQSD